MKRLALRVILAALLPTLTRLLGLLAGVVLATLLPALAALLVLLAALVLIWVLLAALVLICHSNCSLVFLPTM
jgi:hypothetical protein